MTRTVVSFEAPEQSFPMDRNEADEPAGRGLADLVSVALDLNGIDHHGPENRGDWAWDFIEKRDHAKLECIVGYVGDAPIQWLIVTTVRPQERFRKRSRDQAQAGAASARDAWIRSIEAVCNGPHGFTNVRWYYQSDYDRDHGRTWSPSPFG